jgi:hypothetical protein
MGRFAREAITNETMVTPSVIGAESRCGGQRDRLPYVTVTAAVSGGRRADLWVLDEATFGHMERLGAAAGWRCWEAMSAQAPSRSGWLPASASPGTYWPPTSTSAA